MAKTGVEYTGICHISVGSNLNPERNIIRALTHLHGIYPLTGVSKFYKTKAIDRPEQPDYLNGVVSIEYSGVVRDLKYEVLRKIEELFGRERSKDSYAARTIDLDLILCGSLALHEIGLIVPDPDIRNRPFLVAGLLDLNPTIDLPDNPGVMKGLARTPEVRQLQVARSFSIAIKERFTT